MFKSFQYFLFSANIIFAVEITQWDSFDWREYGLTQAEFTLIQNSSLNKEQVLHMLEIGIKPAEYFKKPWISLRVSEEEWLLERSKGMSDQDIDRSFDSSDGYGFATHASLFIPGYFQWTTHQAGKALAFELGSAAFLGSSIYYAQKSEPAWTYLLTGAIAVHLWSWGDAIWGREKLKETLPLISLNLNQSTLGAWQIQSTWNF